MAEKILRIPIGELEVVRLVCSNQNCGGVAEIPVERLEALVGAVLCPSCGHGFPIKNVGAVGGLKALGMSMRNFTDQEQFILEFVVPDPNG